MSNQGLLRLAEDLRASVERQAATTLSTITLQSGTTRVVIALLQSGDWVQLKVLETTPSLTQLGASLEIADELRLSHENVLKQLQTSGDPVQEMQKQVEIKLANNNGSPELYAAMAESLAAAWRDVRSLLADRQNLLILNVNYHRSAGRAIDRMENLELFCDGISFPNDEDTARRILTELGEFKRSMLEAFMAALQDGRILLENLQQIESIGTNDSRPGNTRSDARNAISQVQIWLEALHDRRRVIDKKWTLKKSVMEQAIQMALLTQELVTLDDLLKIRHEGIARCDQLGDSTLSAEFLLTEHHKLLPEAKEMQDRSLKITRATDSLSRSSEVNLENATEVYRNNLITRAYLTLNYCSEYLHLIDMRTDLLNQAISFFRNAQSALMRLDQVEVDFANADALIGSPDLAALNLKIVRSLEEITQGPLEQGHNLLAAAEASNNRGTDGVRRCVEALENKKITMENRCTLHQEESLRLAQSLTIFLEQYNELYSWLVGEGEAFTQGHQDMGSILVMAQDFLDKHKKLNAQLKEKTIDLEHLQSMMSSFIDHVVLEQRDDIETKMVQLRDQWHRFESYLAKRIELGEKYAGFHSLAVKVAHQFDAAEDVLKVHREDGKQGSSEEMWLACQQQVLQLNATGVNFLEHTKEEATRFSAPRVDPHLDLKRACLCVETLLEHFKARQAALADSWAAWQKRETALRETSVQWQRIVMESSRTLDWVSRLDTQFYPILDTEETIPRILVRLLEDRQSRVLPEAKRAQTEVELRLRAVETLQVQGESITQRDKLISQLLELNQRFTVLVSEYQVLLQMMIHFFKNVAELEKTTENLLSQFRVAIMPIDVPSVERLIMEHESSKNAVLDLFQLTSSEFDQIVVRIKQQESPPAAIRDEEKMYAVLGSKQQVWEQSWMQRKEQLEHHLQRCQFDADLHQLNAQLGELSSQLSRVRGQLGESLTSARANSQAFVAFEKTIELLEKRVTIFVNTAERLLTTEHISVTHVQQELERLQARWAGLRSQVSDSKRLIDLSVQYFTLVEEAEEWSREGSRLLVTIARKSTAVRTPEEATVLLNEVERFLKQGELKQDERIAKIKNMASHLYGDERSQQITTVYTDNREMIESFSVVSMELTTLAHNLQTADLERIQKESEELAAARAETEAARRATLAAEQAMQLAEQEAARAIAQAAEDARRAAEAEAARQIAVAADEARRAEEAEAARRALQLAEEARRLAELEAVKSANQAQLEAKRAADAESLRLEAIAAEEARRAAEAEAARLAMQQEREAKMSAELDALRKAAELADSNRRAAEAETARLVAEAAEHAKRTAEAEAARSAAQVLQEARRVAEIEAAKLAAEQQRIFAEAQAQRLALQQAEEARRAAEAETAILAAQAADLKRKAEDEALKVAEAEAARRAAEEARKLAEQEAARRAMEAEEAAKAAIAAAMIEAQKVLVVEAPPTPNTAPVFVESLHDAVIEQGNKFSFQCRATGLPAPGYEWYKNGTFIKNNPDYKESVEDGLAKLCISETFSEDTAKFTCRAWNVAGDAQAHATLTVKEQGPKLSAPQFSKMLEDATAKEGGKHQFECVVHGYPLPTVQWFKNGVCIDSSPDYICTFNNGQAILLLDEVYLEDEATFSCQAYNRLGNCRCEAKLFVQPKFQARAPVFITPLSNVMARTGEKLRLECEVESAPESIFTWTKDGKPIKETQDIRVEKDNQKSTLVIQESFPKDAGLYVAKAKNSAGEATTTCNVIFKGRLPQETSDSEMASDFEAIKPLVQMSLRNTEAIAGTQIKLDCVITGQPEPEVIWYHNGVPVKESKDVQLIFKGDRCTLLIKEALAEEAGEYKIVAINSAGEVSSACNVSVLEQRISPIFESSQRISGTPPKFIKLLSDILVPEGETATMECEVEGTPAPVITWLFNNKPVEPNDRYEMVHDEESRKVCFTISDAQASDRGVYTARATNPLGNVKCFAHFVVKSHMETPDMARRGWAPVAPSFTELLHDSNVISGDSARFECIVAGKPTPKVKWLFNDTPVSGRDFLVSTSGQRQVISIPEVNPSLAGKYSCVAENEVGKATSSANLLVEDVPANIMESSFSLDKQESLESFSVRRSVFAQSSSSFSTTLGGETHGISTHSVQSMHQNGNQAPVKAQTQRVEEIHQVNPVPITFPKKRKATAPHFITPLNGKIVDQGADILLEGIIDGYPTPTVSWLKNSQELPSNCEVKYEHNKVTLIMRDLVVEDAGRYSCKVENEAGTACSTADIVVKKTVFPPVIARRLQAQVLKIGERARMEVEVAGTPTPTVTWHKDGVPITTGSIPGINIQQIGDFNYLIFEQVTASHGGQYSVTATNCGGRAQSIADVAVMEARPEISLEVTKLVFEDIEEEKRQLNLQRKSEEKKNSALFAEFLPQQQQKTEMVSAESIRQEFRSSSITKGVTHLSHEVNMQGIEPRASTPHQIQVKTEQSSNNSELSSSWHTTSRPYSPVPPRPLTPGSRVPNPEGLMMEKLWSPARAPSPAMKSEQVIERSSSPFPSAEARSMEKQWTPSRVSTLSKTSESVERSASPRPRSEGLQMEKLWAHKYEKKSESINVVQENTVEKPTVAPTTPAVQPPAPVGQSQAPLLQTQAPLLQPQIPVIQNQEPLAQPQAPSVFIPASTPWKQEETFRNFSQSSSTMSETRSQTITNEQKRVDPPFMAPTPKPVFQPISPEKQVQHYVAATEKVVHKLNPMYDPVEITSQTMSQFQSQSSSLIEQNITTSTETNENGESSNPNVVTERGVKPSEAKKIWAQRMASSSQSGVSVSMPKPILKKQPAIKQQSAPSQDESLEMLGLVPGPPPEIGYMHRQIEENNAIARTVETQRQSAPKEPLKAPPTAFAKTPSPAPKSNVTPTRQIRTSPGAKRSLTPTFTVKPFEPFQPLEPFPFRPDPEAPRTERLPPPPTPTRFEKGDFSSDVERDLDSVRIAAKWRPYESDNEDQPTYRRVRPPSTPLFNSRPKSTEPEPLPPSRFERPIDIEQKTGHTPAGLQLSDFKSAMTQSSNLSTQQSSSSTVTGRRLATSMEQRVTHSSSTTTTKTSGSPAFSSAKHDVLKKPLSPPKKRGEFLPESGYMADTDEPRRQLKKQAEDQVVKETPPPIVQHTPEPKIHKMSPVMRETPLQQKAMPIEEEAYSVTSSSSAMPLSSRPIATSKFFKGKFSDSASEIKPHPEENVPDSSNQNKFTPISNMKNQHNGFTSETTQRMHMDESEQFSHRRVVMEKTTKVIHYGQQQEITTLEPFPYKPDSPQPRREHQRVQPPPTPSKFIRGEFRESDYESDSIKIKPKWNPNDESNDDLHYRKVTPNLESSRQSTLERVKTNEQEVQSNISKQIVQQNYHVLPASASGVAHQQLSGMGQAFKSKAQNFMNDLTNGAAKKPSGSEPTAYREESRQSEMGSKCIDPDTGLIYFKYDFGYEVGLVLPGEGKNMNVGPQQPTVRPPLQLPDNQSEVEFPIIHERTEEVKHAKKIRWESESELSDFEHQRSGPRIGQPSPSSVSTSSPAHWNVQPGESGRAFLRSGMTKEEMTTPPSTPSTPASSHGQTLGQHAQNCKPPMFVTPLRDIAVINGNQARFECIVQAEPTPNVVWSKNGIILDNSATGQIHFRNGVCRLYFPQALQGYAGTYTCTATNIVGTASCSASLQVSGERRPTAKK